MPERPGDALVKLATEAVGELLLVAPFVKVGALERLLMARKNAAPIKVVTRWRLDELAAGVSDLEVFPLVKANGGSVALHPSLHAKYYATDSRALVGSANITAAALGWRSDANLEILVESSSGRLLDFEDELNRGTVIVDERLYESFKSALAEFVDLAARAEDAASPISFGEWRPELRHPADLFLAYLGAEGELSSASKEAASKDLGVLVPPSGMDRRKFSLWVGTQLRQHPEVMAIDGFLRQPRRFGEMRSFIERRGALDGNRTWQTWMRWLLHFLGGEYAMNVANHSEIFSRRDTAIAVEEEPSRP